MLILFSGNTASADYEIYKREYNLIGNCFNDSSFEIGYKILCKMGNILDLNYNTFLIIYFSIGIVLIISTVVKFTNNFAFVTCLYAIYPFLYDVVQVRNFMAMSIIIYSIRYLIGDKKNDIYKYVLGVVIAMTFHSISIIYILFIFIKKIDNKRKLFKNVIVYSVIFLLLKPLIIKLLIILFPKKAVLYYMSEGTRLDLITGYVIYVILNFLLVKYSYDKVNLLKYNDNYLSNKDRYDKYIKFSDLALKINIILIGSIILVMININFLRIHRNILVLNYILYSIPIAENKYMNKKDIMLNKIIVVYFVICISCVFLFNSKYFNAVVYPIFTQNIILKKFN